MGKTVLAIIGTSLIALFLLACYILAVLSMLVGFATWQSHYGFWSLAIAIYCLVWPFFGVWVVGSRVIKIWEDEIGK